MYTPIQFGKDLKKKVAQKQGTLEIAQWAMQLYLDVNVNNDKWFLRVLLVLDKMELGPEFAFTYEKLDKIADNLISGKEIEI